MQACRASGDIPQEHCSLPVYFKKKKHCVCCLCICLSAVCTSAHAHEGQERGRGVFCHSPLLVLLQLCLTSELDAHAFSDQQFLMIFLFELGLQMFMRTPDLLIGSQDLFCLLGKWNKENKAKKESMQHDFIDVAYVFDRMFTRSHEKRKPQTRDCTKEQQRQKMGHYSKTDAAGAYAQREKAEECQKAVTGVAKRLMTYLNRKCMELCHQGICSSSYTNKSYDLFRPCNCSMQHEPSTKARSDQYLKTNMDGFQQDSHTSL